MPICLSALFRVSCAARSASSVFGICLSRFSLRRMFCLAVSICAFSSPICASAICSCSCAAACASSYAVFAHFTCSSVGACSDSTAGRGCSTEPQTGQEIPACRLPARMPAASGCMPEAARLPPVPARDTPFVFSAVFSALYAGFYNQRSDFSKSSCDWSICRSSASWNTSNWTSLNIWITTATTGSRQNGRACRLQFTDNKPSQLLEQFLLRLFV